jgi:hypothetical protein
MDGLRPTAVRSNITAPNNIFVITGSSPVMTTVFWVGFLSLRLKVTVWGYEVA